MFMKEMMWPLQLWLHLVHVYEDDDVGFTSLLHLDLCIMA